MNVAQHVQHSRLQYYSLQVLMSRGGGGLLAPRVFFKRTLLQILLIWLVWTLNSL